MPNAIQNGFLVDSTGAAVVSGLGGGGGSSINARSFDGSDDVIRVTSPAYFSGAYTWAAVVQRADIASYVTMMSIGGAGTATPDVAASIGGTAFLPDAAQWHAGGGAASQEGHAWSTTNLVLLAVTRAAASSPRFHKFESGTWTHLAPTSDVSASPADWTGLADDELRFGNWNSSFNFFKGTMVMQALSRDTALSDGQVEALAGGNRTTYVAAGFDHLWEFTQASTGTGVTDGIGSLNQIGITGTSVTTLSLPSSIYVVGA